MAGGAQQRGATMFARGQSPFRCPIRYRLDKMT